MADINFDDKLGENETVALIELLFFAYRDFEIRLPKINPLVTHLGIRSDDC